LIDQFLQSIPPLAVYLIVGIVILVESLGVPFPGEITLVSAALLSSSGVLAVSPLWIAVCASSGAIAGDSIGFAVGHRFGKPLFDRLGRRFPKHFGPKHVAFAERVFTRYGVWAVFFGRFIALLRIFAGPLAGSLKMPYSKFLAANAAGGIAWAAGTTYVIYYLGVAAETWLSRFSWIGLIVAVLAGVAVSLWLKRKTGKLVEATEVQDREPEPAPE
jgi:membrane protein DedA with SNARE-associated domain